MTDLSQSPAILGAWRARHSRHSASPEGFADILRHALSLSVDWIDHADVYDDGAVETLHREALQILDLNDRDRLRVITKTGVRLPNSGQSDVRVCHYRSDGAYITQSVETSLARLRVSRIDLLLLHRPDYLMMAEETVSALEALKSAGKIAAYGISNFSISQHHLMKQAGASLAAHQLEISPLQSSALDNGTCDLAQADKIPVLAWSPLGGGRLFNTNDVQAQRLRPVLETIGQRSEIQDIAAVALAWLRRHPANIIPILGTMNPERLTSEVHGIKTVKMTEQDWYEVLEAGRGARVR